MKTGKPEEGHKNLRDSSSKHYTGIVDGSRIQNTGACKKVAKDDRRLTGHRKALEELKEEAKELLTLTYSLNLDDKKSNTKTLLEPPKVIFKDENNVNIDTSGKNDSQQKTCKLIGSRVYSKSTETNKQAIEASTNAKNSIQQYTTTVDVIDPSHQLERSVAYPLDLSINEFSRCSPLVSNATRESYREMLIAIQQKYTVIMRMFEEVNEQRMSYIEGLHEMQGDLDNARSVIQLQKGEIVKVASQLEVAEASIVNKNKEIEYIRDALSVHVHHEEELENDLRYQQECIEGMNAQIEQLQNVIAELTARVEELSFMPKVKGCPGFEDQQFTYQDALLGLQELINMLAKGETKEDELETMLSETIETKKPLKYLEAVINFPITMRLLDLYKQRFTIEEKFNRDLSLMRQAKDKEIERNNEITQKLVDSYAARVHQANAESLNAKNKLDALTRRTTILPVSTVEKSKINDKIYNHLRHPTKVKLLEKPILKKSTFKENFLCVVNRVVKIGEVKRGTMVSKHTFSVNDIHKVEFGFMSSSYLLHNAVMKNEVVYPWQFFSITTSQREFNLICTNDDILDVLIIGLNRMIVSKGFNITLVDISSMRLLRAKMKMHYHCTKNNISPRKMWLNAVRKAAEQRKLTK